MRQRAQHTYKVVAMRTVGAPRLQQL